MPSDFNTVNQSEQHENSDSESGETSIRGLSAINKVHGFEEEIKARLVNHATGEIIEITEELKHKFRLQRMNARVHAWAMALKSVGGLIGKAYRQVMITLTYDPMIEWKPNHIRDFMKGVRRVLGGDLRAYSWVAEMQERGVPHYHVYLVVNRGARIPMPDKAYGQRGHKLWGHGMTKIETARNPFYLVKYTGKEHQKMGFYRNMRIFAVWIAKGFIEELEKRKFRVSSLPRWLQKIAIEQIKNVGYEHPKPSPGGGWEFMDKIYRSDWEYQQLVEGEWVNMSTSLANLQYDDMTDGEKNIIDFADFSRYCKEMEGNY